MSARGDGPRRFDSGRTGIIKQRLRGRTQQMSGLQRNPPARPAVTWDYGANRRALLLNARVTGESPPDAVQSRSAWWGELSGVRGYLALVGIGVLVAGLADAALVWDGASLLFDVLDQQAPATPHYRFVHLPFDVVVLLASALTSDLSLLRRVFGLAYAAVPLIALATSWWVVRARSMLLFTWAALGIGLGTLPGQFQFTSEAIMATQLVWPIFLATLTRSEARFLPLLAGLSLAILFAHPFAIVLFAFAAGMAWLTGERNPVERSNRRRVALTYVALAVAAGLKSWLLRSDYESDALSLDFVRYALSSSFTGLPLIAIACAWIAGALLLSAPILQARSHPGQPWAAIARAGALVCVGGAGLALFIWGSDSSLWLGSIGFKTPVLLSVAPFVLLATVEGIFHKPDAAGMDTEWQYRRPVLNTVATVFALTLIIQSVSWRDVTQRLEFAMSSSTWGCQSMAALPWLANTPVNYWSVQAYSLLLQSRAPAQVVATSDECWTSTPTAALPHNLWQTRPGSTGWFDLTGLEQRLVSEQTTPRGCWSMLTSGWYATEWSGLDSWWRWSAGQGVMRILTDNDRHVVLYGEIRSIIRPNQVDIVLNNKPLMTMDITWDDPRAFLPVQLDLSRGENLLQFNSHQSAIEVPGDARPLALSLGNVRLETQDLADSCPVRL